MPKTNRNLVYVGTYTKDQASGSHREAGIPIYTLDLATGGLELISTAEGVEDPSFLVIDSTNRFLYAVSESAQPEGIAHSFAVDPVSGGLRLINQQSTGGGGPCHIAFDSTGRFLVVAHYGSGSVGLLPIGVDGGLEPLADHVQHSGVPGPGQRGPHAHCAVSHDSGAVMLVTDLGLDKVFCYMVDRQSCKLVAHTSPFAIVRPGAGPRHLVFSFDYRFLYVVHELDSAVTVLGCDPQTYALQPLQTISTLPSGFSGRNAPAEIKISPSGRFLYVSNRGLDSLVWFGIDPQTGLLEYAGTAPTGGSGPRHFTFDPSGAWLLVANQNSNNILSFQVDPPSGALTRTAHEVCAEQPVCLQVVRM